MKKTEIAALVMLLGIMACAYLMGRAEVRLKMEKQAIFNGVGTYDENEQFEWTK